MNVAFVGCGQIARRFHAPAFAALNDEGFRIVAACDVVEDNAKALASAYEGCRAYTNLDEMLAREAIDIVDVVTQEQDRPAPLMRCLEEGKHSFCEKPLAGRSGQFDVRAVDVEDGKRIVDAWRKAGTFFGISFNYRFAPHAVRMKEVIDSGEAGEPVLINVCANLNAWSHVIDLMRWFNGEVVELLGYISGPAHEADRSATLKFANGSLGTLVGTMRLSMAHTILRMEWVGTKERLVITDLCGQFERYLVGRKGVSVWHQPLAMWRAEYEQTFGRSVHAYARAVAAGQEPPITGIDAMRELEIDAGIFTSAERGTPIRIEHYSG